MSWRYRQICASIAALIAVAAWFGDRSLRSAAVEPTCKSRLSSGESCVKPSRSLILQTWSSVRQAGSDNSNRDRTLIQSGHPDVAAVPIQRVSATSNVNFESGVSSFAGFVPAVPQMAVELAGAYQRCQSGGSLCGHTSYVALIPQIMSDDQEIGSWAKDMEERLAGYLGSRTFEFNIEQVRCGEVGCLVDLTQDKAGRTYSEESALFQAARATLGDESWFKDEFFVSYDESPFTGYFQHWVRTDTKFEELWIFARKKSIN